MSVDQRELVEAEADAEQPGNATKRTWRRLRWLWHEWTLAIVAALAVAIGLTWPTLRDPAHTVPGDIGDPTMFAWQIAWGGHALMHNPFHIWHSNAFYPDWYTFGYTDALVGYAPFGLIGSGMEAALIRYNVLFVLMHALAFIGAYALVRQLGAHPVAGAVAGVAWAFSPWRLAHAGHMNVLSVGGIALCLAMLARGHGWSLRYGYRPERQRPGWVLAGWLVGAWQITLGFAIGLAFAYVLIAIGVVAAVGYGVSWVVRRRRPVFPPRLFAANLAGGTVFGVVTVSMGAMFLKVIELNPQAQRGLEWTDIFSPPWRGLFIAPGESWLWGDLHAPARDRLDWPPEMALLPGAALLALASMGLVVSVFRVHQRVLLGVGAFVGGLLCLGTTLGGDGDPGYLTLSRYLPGWDALRTPGRMMVWVTLLLAILAAGAVSAMVEPGLASLREGQTRWTARWSSRLALAFAMVIPLGAVVVEGVNRTDHPVAPPAPAVMAVAPEPMLILPSEGGIIELNMLLWTTNGFPRVANGLVGFVPTGQENLRNATAAFPDIYSVSYLRRLGIRSVVVLPGELGGTRWEGILDRPFAGLGITREEIDGAYLYRLS
jgi:hypothetical protein